MLQLQRVAIRHLAAIRSVYQRYANCAPASPENVYILRHLQVLIVEEWGGRWGSDQAGKVEGQCCKALKPRGRALNCVCFLLCIRWLFSAL